MTRPDKKVPLVECFGPTIQGEGAVIGQQTYFLRFGLCDFECKMCDSMHAVDPAQVKQNAKWLTQHEIFELLKAHRSAQGEYSTKWVTFSGGNPCIHDLTELVQSLTDDDWYIAVETQGTLCPNWLYGCDVVTVSPKGPGMGENCDLQILDKFMKGFHWQDGVNIKIVVFDERDLEFAKSIYERYILVKRDINEDQFYLSLGNPYPPGKEVVGEDNSGRTLRDRLMTAYEHLLPQIMYHPVLNRVKFLPQLHVLVWGNKQGV